MYSGCTMSNDYEFVGPYRLERTLGSGSFGKVKREAGKEIMTCSGYTSHHRYPSAIKIMDKERINELNMMEKVKREIRILHSFHHPHIVRLYSAIFTIFP